VYFSRVLEELNKAYIKKEDRVREEEEAVQVQAS
jgi:hypothetical protein